LNLGDELSEGTLMNGLEHSVRFEEEGPREEGLGPKKLYFPCHDVHIKRETGCVGVCGIDERDVEHLNY
jgi:hypothetical protein